MLNSSLIQKAGQIKDPEARRKYLKAISLPPKLYQIFFGVETADKIWQITRKYQLDSQKTQNTAYLVGMILLGEIKINSFIRNLEEKCQLEPSQIKTLAYDINQQIFLPVKQELMNLHQVQTWPGQSPATESPNPSQKPEPPLEGNIVNLKA